MSRRNIKIFFAIAHTQKIFYDVLMKTIKAKDSFDIPDNFTGIAKLPGRKEWLKNGKLHRKNGPAVIWSDGDRFWIQNGLYHRLDGPAIEWREGDKEYWTFGEEMNEYEFDIFQFMWENTSQKRKTKKLMKTFVKLAKTK